MAKTIELDKLSISKKLTSSKVDSKDVFVGGESVKAVLADLPSFDNKVTVVIGGRTYELHGTQVDKPNTVEMNGTEYSSLSAALEAMSFGTNRLRLLGNCDLDAMETGDMPPVSKSVVIDLNGYTLKDTGSHMQSETRRLFSCGDDIRTYMNLSVELKNGSVETQNMELLSFNSPNGVLNVHDVEFTAQSSKYRAFRIYGAAAAKVSECEIDYTGYDRVFDIQTVLTPPSVVISGNAINYRSTAGGEAGSLSGGVNTTVIATGASACLSTDGNAMNTSGGFMYSAYGMYNSGGTLYVGGDAVNYSNEYSGGAVSIKTDSYEPHSIDIVINGLSANCTPGSESGEDNYSLLIDWNEGKKSWVERFDIMSGTFGNWHPVLVDPDNDPPKYEDITTGNFNWMKIKGGTFNKEITPGTNLAEGYVCEQAGDMWTVGPQLVIS